MSESTATRLMHCLTCTQNWPITSLDYLNLSLVITWIAFHGNGSADNIAVEKIVSHTNHSAQSHHSASHFMSRRDEISVSELNNTTRPTLVRFIGECVYIHVYMSCLQLHHGLGQRHTRDCCPVLFVVTHSFFYMALQIFIHRLQFCVRRNVDVRLDTNATHEAGLKRLTSL